ncbi:ester cyclase [Nucisporomicrobium flavum]|uniref:ester cyclase n=1 Tax=Nucisporomicrobium flavum TaxID=2785915 RepID=UPI0018F32A74|nr:ester cyclase [Nucisporomicrobium flavum]
MATERGDWAAVAEQLQAMIRTLEELRTHLGAGPAPAKDAAANLNLVHDTFVGYLLGTPARFTDEVRRPLAPNSALNDMPSKTTYAMAKGDAAAAKRWLTAFPDYAEKTINIIGNEEYLVLERNGTGTHKGPLVLGAQRLAPTGRTLETEVLDVVRITDGMISHVDVYYDTAGVMRSLGLLPDMPMGHDEKTATPAPMAHASGFVPLSADLRAAADWPVTQGTATSLGSSQSAAAQLNMKNCVGIHEAFVNHQPDRFGELIADDAIWIDVPTGEVLRAGAAAAHHDHGNWQTAFPDSSAEVTNMVANEDWVVVQHRGFGTHSGPLVLGGTTYEPTKRPIDIRVADIVQYRTGQAQLIRNYYDVGMMMLQLGVLPG